MPPIDPADQPENPPESSLRPHRRVLLPVVLLGACGVAFAGLAAPSAPSAAATRPVTVITTAASTGSVALPFGKQLLLLDGPLRPTVVVAAKPVPAPAAPPVDPRASRSRPVVPVDRYVRPCAAGIVSSYGGRDGGFHRGVDLGASYGAPAAAVADGVVIGSGYGVEDGYGILILLRHADGTVTAYAHLSKTLVETGQRVAAGDVIGLVGSTGRSTGPHLHFEVRIGGSAVDPVRWLNEHGVEL